MEIQIEQNHYKIISSGSTGNCEIALKSIAIDMGVSYLAIMPYVKDIQIVLLSHKHFDHLNIKTLQRLQKERPSLRIGCGEWMLPHINVLKNIDVFELGKWYNYGSFTVSIGKLYHDTENCFFRIQKDGYKIFRATDTSTLEGITAKGYDLYCIEANYSEPIAKQMIEQAMEKGEFTHVIGSINSHLSEEQCNDFFYKNKNEHSKLIRLHETRSYL